LVFILLILSETFSALYGYTRETAPALLTGGPELYAEGTSNPSPWSRSRQRTVFLVRFSAGEARAKGTVTIEGVAMGILDYMSPKQPRGSEVDHRTDIFATGVMLVEALTGRRPFEGDRTTDLALAGARWELPGSSTQARAFGDLLQRCLAPDPDDRFDSAALLCTPLIPLLRTCPPLERTASLG
jgi:serine/threonine protein kinase